MIARVAAPGLVGELQQPTNSGMAPAQPLGEDVITVALDIVMDGLEPSRDADLEASLLGDLLASLPGNGGGGGGSIVDACEEGVSAGGDVMVPLLGSVHDLFVRTVVPLLLRHELRLVLRCRRRKSAIVRGWAKPKMPKKNKKQTENKRWVASQQALFFNAF